MGKLPRNTIRDCRRAVQQRELVDVPDERQIAERPGVRNNEHESISGRIEAVERSAIGVEILYGIVESHASSG